MRRSSRDSSRSAWFSWGQERPPAWESIVLDIAAILAVLVAVGGILVARRARHEPSPLSDPAAGKRYGIIVGTEFASHRGRRSDSGSHRPRRVHRRLGLFRGRSALRAARPRLSRDRHGRPRGRGHLRRRGGVRRRGEHLDAPSAVTCLGAGACLLGRAASLLVIAARRARPPQPDELTLHGRWSTSAPSCSMPMTLDGPPGARQGRDRGDAAVHGRRRPRARLSVASIRIVMRI